MTDYAPRYRLNSLYLGPMTMSICATVVPWKSWTFILWFVILFWQAYVTWWSVSYYFFSFLISPTARALTPVSRVRYTAVEQLCKSVCLWCGWVLTESGPYEMCVTKVFTFWPWAGGANPWAKVHQKGRWRSCYPNRSTILPLVIALHRTVLEIFVTKNPANSQRNSKRYPQHAACEDIDK